MNEIETRTRALYGLTLRSRARCHHWLSCIFWSLCNTTTHKITRYSRTKGIETTNLLSYDLRLGDSCRATLLCWTVLGSRTWTWELTPRSAHRDTTWTHEIWLRASLYILLIDKCPSIYPCLCQGYVAIPVFAFAMHVQKCATFTGILRDIKGNEKQSGYTRSMAFKRMQICSSL